MKTASGIFPLLAFLNLFIYASLSGKTTAQGEHKVTDVPGNCPSELDGLSCTSGNQTSLCSSDGTCTGGDKCCKYNCKFQCVKPVQDKVGICPDWDESICPYSRPTAGSCTNDDQCEGKLRCCCNGCKRRCVAPDVKPGRCPVKCGPSSSSNDCQTDEDCSLNMKCCGNTCQDPEPEHPGFCPKDPRSNPRGGPRSDDQCPPEAPLAPLCTSDSECESDEKCCFFACRRKCVKALAVKPGMCPAIMAKCKLPLPCSKCFSDNDCSQNQKCCIICGNVCVEPASEHDGVCPPHQGTKQLCTYNSSAVSCTHDWNCDKNQKCCFSGYQKQCVTSLAEKPGRCPKATTGTKMKNNCQDTCNSDRDCPGNDKCCMGTAGRACKSIRSNERLVY
uniref:Balbiani ring protein 3-like isoform X1 n=1 Tax=Geotrypetes seraphini TaxID=260995 RepID=A0A6P8R789_GEOSA|nr:balbiani ring protein 3-like isoform X1 [Geotrypetes seraphini]XP_033794537.1 balbiani ring protein 3-like isoform X1 [Geotrypetes seraphini]